MGGKASGEPLPDPWKEEERRQALLTYVKEVQPNSVVQFAEQTAPGVVQAMRQTVLNVVGSLPPQYFEVKISTVAESLAQLMLSIMTTGYMFRSAQFRLELQNSLKQLPAHATATGSTTISAGVAPAAAAVSASSSAAGGGGGAGGCTTSGAPAAAAPSAFLLLDSPEYAPGVQKSKVEGEVLRWHLERGLERMPARDYIEMLEAELAALRKQQAAGGAVAIRQASCPESLKFGNLEVLGPDTPSTSAPSSPSGLKSAPAWTTNPVSPLASFGERAGRGGAVSAAQPATMGSGGVPMVVGSPLGPPNELLDYLQGLQANSPTGLKELACSPSSSSGRAVKEAMEVFVARLMGSADPNVLAHLSSEFTAMELSKLLFWLMAVGYTLKSLEARLEMDESLGTPSGASSKGGSSGSGGGGTKGSGDTGSGPNNNNNKKGRGWGGGPWLLPGW